MTAAARLTARATLGGTFARERGRLALAVLAIALGVALGYAIGLVNRAAIDEFAAGMAALAGDADLEVRGPRAGFDGALFADIARVDGVAVASPVVEVDAPIAGRDTPLRVIGVDALRAGAITPALVGKADKALDLVAQDKAFVSPAAARALALHVGDPLPVRTA